MDSEVFTKSNYLGIKYPTFLGRRIQINACHFLCNMVSLIQEKIICSRKPFKSVSQVRSSLNNKKKIKKKKCFLNQFKLSFRN